MNNRENTTIDLDHDVSQLGGFLAGLLVGGLAGAAGMLLLAPQSGEKTRAQIQNKSIELSEQAASTVKDTLKQIRTKANQISDDVQEQTEELQQHGQDMIDEQRDNLGTTLKDLGKAVHT